MATVIRGVQSVGFGNADESRFDSLEAWLAWQEGLHFTAIDLGLDRCSEVAGKLGLYEADFAVISVAGTNGKGSSVAMLDLILRHSGYRTGKYTSPHLLRYNERICIDGREVDSTLLCQTFERIDRARGDISLTYFEFGTLAALDIFCRSGVEIAVLEVGLGGRLDAVNILDADAALVTAIDIDHENWLGDDRESIGREKAGIFRTATPAICSDPKPPQSIVDYADDLGTPLEVLGRDYGYEVYEDHWDWYCGSAQYRGLARPSRIDSCQMQNAAGVLMLLNRLAEHFPVTDEAIRMSMREFRLDGRLQVVPGETPCILDVAHNRQSAAILVENLGKVPVNGNTHCIIGMLKDKDHRRVFKELEKVVDNWYLCDLDSERAASTDELANGLLSVAVKRPSLVKCSNVEVALQQASDMARSGDRILITGSFLSVKAGLLWLGLGH